MPEPETRTVPASRIGGILSSMVVRPSVSGGGSDFNHGEVGALDCRRDSPPDPPAFRSRDPPLSFNRRGSPPSLHRRGSPPPLHRLESPSAYPRRYSPPTSRRRGSPSDFHHRSQRFNEIPGDATRGGSTSPRSRQRLDDGRYGRDFDHSVGSHFGRGFRGGRGGRISRDISPNHRFGRGGRPFGRGYNVSERVYSPPRESVRRNDPNVSPREGDWICRNPSCGNLNFAWRTYCSNCNTFRFESKHHGVSRSPQRAHFHSPPPYGEASRNPGPRTDRGRRDMNGYRSHPHHSVDDRRDFRTGPPSPVPGGRFRPHTRRERPDYYEEDDRVRGKMDRPVHAEWDRGGRRRDRSVPDRRGYDRSPPSPHDGWVHDSRERSRSPSGERSPKVSYMEHGRDARRYDDSDAGRGRGFRQHGSVFRGRGWGDQPGMARGRRGGMY